MTETEKEYKTRNQTWIPLKALDYLDLVGGDTFLKMWILLVRKLHYILKYIAKFKFRFSKKI